MWLALRSQRGQPAGAVQVAVYLTSLDGCAWPSTHDGWCALIDLFVWHLTSWSQNQCAHGYTSVWLPALLLLSGLAASLLA